MTDLEAAQLAQRIAHGWPQRSAIDVDEWATELRPLDAGAAGSAFARLRRERIVPCSVAEFLRTYRVVRSAIVGHRQLDECDDCSGSGWVETYSLIIGEGEHERISSQVQPCSCPAGNVMRPTYEQLASGTLRLSESARNGPPLSTMPIRPPETTTTNDEERDR